MKIGFDLDDTIADHTQNLLKLAHMYGAEVVSTTHNMYDALKTALDETTYKELREKLYGELSLEALPMANAEETIETIANEDNELYIISRRFISQEYGAQWIEEHIPRIKKDNVLFVSEDPHKGEWCEKLGIELFLDNKPEVLAGMPLYTSPILFDRFGSFTDLPFKKVPTWKEFYTLYTKLKNSRE